MGKNITGKITTVFGDDINTDDIIPAWTLQESTERSYFAGHAFENFDKDFIKRCSKEKKNIIIGGDNFACGSSREHAVYAIQNNNVVAVIAASYPDIFYRNAVNNGLIAITVPDKQVLSELKPGTEISIDLDTKSIIGGDKKYQFVMSDSDIAMLKAGGAIGRARTHLAEIIKNGRKYLHYTKAQIKADRPQTIVEKIVSAHINKPVYAGERVDKLPIDLIYFNEVLGPPVVQMFRKDFNDVFKAAGVKPKVFDKDAVCFIPDHTVPSSSVNVSDGITLMEQFSREQGVRCFKEGDGIEHVVFTEEGYIVPGEIILATDSHTDTNGAFNTLAFGVGTTDGYFAMATGSIYDFVVPDTIRIELQGAFMEGVTAKDLILHLLGQLGVAGASKQVMEFGGSGLKNIGLDGRFTIANMVVELGARTAIFAADDQVEDYVKSHSKLAYKKFAPDQNCKYTKTVTVDISTLEPQVAFPHKPDNVTPISKIEDYRATTAKRASATVAVVDSLKITDAFLGACTNGRYEDFVLAARILKGRQVHKDVNFIVIPGSRKIYNRLLAEGILQIFAEAGANIESSNCGPCFGKHMGLIGRDAQMISTSNRNYIGRMGSEKARIFLASPATVTASAIAGEITDPRNYLLNKTHEKTK